MIDGIENLAFFLIVPLIYIISLWIGKVDFYSKRKHSEMLWAEVVEYRMIKSPIRGDYNKLPYAFVKIKGADNLVKLKYATSAGEPFKIGEKVKVFWHKGILMYWDAFDRGISKYLPV
ncbi:MAG: hypothetical protein AAF740_11115 [Bacteroidota bacterium]